MCRIKTKILTENKMSVMGKIERKFILIEVSLWLIFDLWLSMKSKWHGVTQKITAKLLLKWDRQLDKRTNIHSVTYGTNTQTYKVSPFGTNTQTYKVSHLGQIHKHTKSHLWEKHTNRKSVTQIDSWTKEQTQNMSHRQAIWTN